MAVNNRKKLRPWLEAGLRLGWSGLEWSNEQKKEFKVYYPRYGKRGVDAKEHFALFQSWATHTGLYNEWTNDRDPKRWKANLKNAIGKGKEFLEIKEKRSKPDDGPIPYRVYQMVDNPVNGCQVQSSRSPLNEVAPMPDSTTGKQEIVNEDIRLPDGCPDLALLLDDSPAPEQASSLQLLNETLLDLTEEKSSASNVTATAALIECATNISGEPQNANKQDDVVNNTGSQNQHPEMSIIVKYLNETVLSIETVSPSGCCITHGRNEDLSKLCHSLLDDRHALAYGNRDAEEVVLPKFNITSSMNQIGNALPFTKIKRNVEELLQMVLRGLELNVWNGHIYAKRFSRCGVAYTSEQNGFDSHHLPRDMTTDYKKLFDHQIFCTQLENSKKGIATPPHPYVYIAFGQKQFASNMYIYLSVASKLSLDMLRESGIDALPLNLAKLSENLDLSLLLSKTNELDTLANDVNELLNLVDSYPVDNLQ